MTMVEQLEYCAHPTRKGVLARLSRLAVAEHGHVVRVAPRSLPRIPQSRRTLLPDAACVGEALDGDEQGGVLLLPKRRNRHTHRRDQGPNNPLLV